MEEGWLPKAVASDFATLRSRSSIGVAAVRAWTRQMPNSPILN